MWRAVAAMAAMHLLPAPARHCTRASIITKSVSCSDALGQTPGVALRGWPVLAPSFVAHSYSEPIVWVHPLLSCPADFCTLSAILAPGRR